jgi:hypothetical protein
MSANVASQWGWYQIAGDATIKKTAVKVDPAGTTKVYLSGTSGRVMQTSVAGRMVIGARWITATTVTRPRARRSPRSAGRCSRARSPSSVAYLPQLAAGATRRPFS